MSNLPGLLRAAVCALVWWSAASTPLRAQLDYRNLDDDRPTRIEDAYAVERYAFELVIPYTFERERGGATVHASVLELAYGLLPNTQIGLKLPLALVRAGGTTSSGLSGLRAFVLYNFNSESLVLPAFSLRTDITLPVGSLGGNGSHVTVKGNVTRSFGGTRLHLNGAHRLGPDGSPAVVEAAERWWFGGALDRTLWRQSVLLIGEVYARRLTERPPTEVTASLGLRWQWRPGAVVDLGVARRLGLHGPDIAMTIGITNAFAIPGLVPRGR